MTQSTQQQKNSQQQIPAVSNIMCRTIPCSLSNMNADSLDWSSTGFLSFGCQNIVVICHFAHGKHLLQLQTLHRHKSPVNRTAWPEIINDWAPARSVNLNSNNNNNPGNAQTANTFSDQLKNSIDNLDESGLIRVASSDVYGTIIIWNMLDAAVLAQISTPQECLSKTVVDMKWISCSHRPKSSSSSFVASNNYNYLLVLYSSSVMALYETEVGDVIWLKNFSELEVKSFAIDPFDSTRLMMTRKPFRQQQSLNQNNPENNFYLVENMVYDKPPNGTSRDFALRRSTLSAKDSTSNSGVARKTIRSLDKVGGFFLNVSHSSTHSHLDEVNKSNRRVIGQTLDECGLQSSTVLSQQCSFNPAFRNQAIVLVNRELVVIDLEYEIILYIINVERNIADISCFYPCRQRNLIITLHESGTIAARLLRKIELESMPDVSSDENYAKLTSTTNLEDRTYQGSDCSADSKVVSFSYNSICQSEILRQTRQGKICGFKVSPVDETRVALLMSNGKIIIHQLSLISRSDWYHDIPPVPSKNGGKLSITSNQRTVPVHLRRMFETLPFLNELIKIDEYYEDKVHDKRRYQFLMTQMLSFLDSQPTAIRMGPPATIRNWRFHKPLLAVGNIGGTVQIFNLSSGHLYRELGIHSCPIRGIEWVCLNAFISYAYTDVSPQTGELLWELSITDIETGKTVQLKAGRSTESSMIQSVRVSHLRQYFIIVFRDEPFEIWDLENLSLLRLVSKKFTGIVAAEWSPLYSKRIDEPTEVQSNLTDPDKKTNVNNPSDSKGIPTNKRSVPAAPIRENFVVTNKMGELFHFSIAGSVVKEMSRIPPETTMTGAATAVAWKSDHVVLGDGDGNISIWDLKNRESRTEATMRGLIRKIRFAPGRGNMKILLLFDDGVDIWDIRLLRRLTNIKSPRDHLFKVCDIDWAGSDRPVILTSDGLIIVTDLELKQFSSPLKKLHLSDMMSKNECLFEYHLLHPGDRYVFRTMHYHNINDSSYSKLRDVKTLLSPEEPNDQNISQESKNSPNDTYPDDIKTACNNDGIVLEHDNLLTNAKSTSKLLADHESYAFWQMVAFMLNRNHGTATISQLEKNLDTMFDIFLDCDSFIQLQRDRASILTQRKTTHGHYMQLYELLIALGQKKQASNILLETEPHSERGCQLYLLNSLRACLTETLRISNSNCDGAFPMIKLVATNLIAAGNLHEGCRLLNLIDRNSDACHYLISVSQWYEAVRLAKLRLLDKNGQNSGNNTISQLSWSGKEVMAKWCDYLISNNQINVALLALLSLGEFVKVIDLLVCIGDIERAAILTRICIEQAINGSKSTSNDNNNDPIRQEHCQIILDTDKEPDKINKYSSNDDHSGNDDPSGNISGICSAQYDDISNTIDDRRLRLDVLNSEVAYKAVQRYYYTLKDFNMTALQEDYRQLLQLFGNNHNIQDKSISTDRSHANMHMTDGIS